MEKLPIRRIARRDRPALLLGMDLRDRRADDLAVEFERLDHVVDVQEDARDLGRHPHPHSLTTDRRSSPGEDTPKDQIPQRIPRPLVHTFSVRGRPRRTRRSRGRPAGGIRRRSSGRSRTSGSGAGPRLPRGAGRVGGITSSTLPAIIRIRLPDQAVGVGQRVKRVGQRLQVGAGPARFDPEVADTWPLRASPRGSGRGRPRPGGRRPGSSAGSTAAATDETIPPRLMPGHAEPGRVDLGPAGEPGRGAADVADPLAHRQHRALDVGREESLLGVSCRPALAVIGELDEQGGHAAVGQPRRQVAREGEVGPEDVQHHHRRPLRPWPLRSGGNIRRGPCCSRGRRVEIGDGNRTAETV